MLDWRRFFSKNIYKLDWFTKISSQCEIWILCYRTFAEFYLRTCVHISKCTQCSPNDRIPVCGSALLLVTYVNIYSLNLTSEQYGNFFKATRNIIQKLTERFNTDFFYLYMYTIGVSGGRGRGRWRRRVHHTIERKHSSLTPHCSNHAFWIF